MKRRKRSAVAVFGLSFLDVMFCGFGSVILLVMIVNADTVRKRDELHRDLRSEVTRLEREVRIGEDYLVTLRSELDDIERSRAAAARAAAEARTRIDESAAAMQRAERAAAERAGEIDALRDRLGALESRVESAPREQPGDKVRRFVGSGDRQYLTGLKMGGERILVLVDVSASMLAETVVDVVLLRNQSAERKRAARKWRQALATVEWLLSQLPAESQFRIVAFAAAALPVPDGDDAGWIDARDAPKVEQAVQALRDMVPGGGTSLYHAFAAVRSLSPRPDNVFLITDGLPTRGEAEPRGTTVSASERLRHFDEAVRALPAGIPVNTVLMPMEGDPMAAPAFWRLATHSSGALITPSRDWP